MTRAKRPVRLPVVLSEGEVRRLLVQLQGVKWLMASLLYGAGLRQHECLMLRVKDVDFAYPDPDTRWKRRQGPRYAAARVPGAAAARALGTRARAAPA